jgi:hypothetical protein
MTEIKIGSFADLVNEMNKTPQKPENDFDDVVELFKECGLTELLDEDELEDTNG